MAESRSIGLFLTAGLVDHSRNNRVAGDLQILSTYRLSIDAEVSRLKYSVGAKTAKDSLSQCKL